MRIAVVLFASLSGLAVSAGCGGSDDSNPASSSGDGPGTSGAAGQGAAGAAGTSGAGGGGANAGGSGAAGGASGGNAGGGGAGAAGVGGGAGSGNAGAAGAGAGAGGTAGASGGGGNGAAGKGGAPFDPKPGDVVADDLAAKVVGTYGMRARVAVIQEVPILGKMTSTTVAYGLTQIEKVGQGLVATERGCHVDIESMGAAQTTIPDAVPSSVPPSKSAFHFYDDAGTLRFVRVETVIAVGAKLTDPAKDALPTKPDDPRVWDQDGDGNPGVTVKVAGLASGDIFAVQRQRSVYYGTLSGAKLSGFVWDASDQSVIGATNPILNQNISQVQDTDATKSTIVYAKVDAAYDCAKLVAEKATLFK